MSSGIAYIGSLTNAEKIALYNSVVEEGFNTPFDRPQELAYTKIAAVKTPKDMLLMPGHVPEKVSFGFSPPNGKAEELTTGRHARPMTMHSIEVQMKVYTDTLKVRRFDFEKDIMGILDKAPRDLRRTDQKNPDVLLAALLRNGKTANDYTNTSAFFATGKPCSPEGMISDTYDNLFTSRSLTEANVAYVMQQMMSIKAADGLTLGVRPDTLVVPFSLWHDSAVATQLKQIVFSNGSNAAPGQASSTAAMGDNPMAMLKWVKNIVVLQELQDGQSINNTSWYVMDCSSGPQSLCYALGSAAEYVSLMDPRDKTVFFNDEYYWGWRKIEGANYALPQYIARCEA